MRTYSFPGFTRIFGTIFGEPVALAFGAGLLLALAPQACAVPPANDAFEQSQQLVGSTGTVTANNTEATREDGEPDHDGGSSGRSVWYDWTPLTQGSAIFTTAGSNFDTVLAVYTGGSVSMLSFVASNDDIAGSTSSVIFLAQAGVTYHIAVDGFGVASGNISLQYSGPDTYRDPVISSPAVTTPIVGQPFTYQIAAANGATTYSAMGLPAGLSLNPATGVISGTPLAAGTFQVILSATNPGGTGTSTLTLTVAAPVLPTEATVALTNPTGGAVITSGTTLALAATLSDLGSDVVKVQFYLGSTLLADIPAPGPYVFNMAAPAAGAYQITAVAIDRFGRQATSSSNVTVVNAASSGAPGSATLQTGIDGHRFAAGDSVPLDVSFEAPTDGDEIERIDFLADGAPFASQDASGQPFGVATHSHLEPKSAMFSSSGNDLYQASYTVPATDKIVNMVAVALTKLGKSISSPAVSIQTVSMPMQKPLLVRLSAPADLSLVRVNTALNIPVDVVTPPSTVLAKMEYYLNRLKLGETTQGPFGIDFTPPASGLFVVTAIGTNTEGISSASTSVRLKAVVAPMVTLAVHGRSTGKAGGPAFQVLFSRAGDVTDDLLVRYKVSGSAKSGVDYTGARGLPLSGVVTIPAGKSRYKLKILTHANAGATGEKTLNFKLLPGTEGLYDIANPKKAKFKIETNP